MGREIRHVAIAIEDFAAAAAEQGVPSEVVEVLTFVFGEVLDGRNARLADGVQRALDREPRGLQRLRTRRRRHLHLEPEGHTRAA